MTSLSSIATDSFAFMTPQTTLATVHPSEQVAVVTGANRGLGFGIVKELCEQFDGFIYLTAKNKTKGEEALQVLKGMGVCKNPDKLRFHELNVASRDHCEEFFWHMRDTHKGFDILINNAAIAFKRNAHDPFYIQAKKTIETNYVGLVQICTFLFPLLRPHGRVVNLSSSAGHLSQITNLDFKKKLMEDCNTERKLTDMMYQFIDLTKTGDPRAHINAGWPNSAYAVSKIGVNLLTRIQQRLFDAEKGTDKIVNAIHPGYVITNMSSFMGNTNVFEAAQAPVWLALLPHNVAKPKGEFVWNDLRIMDMDSFTTPAKPDDIQEFDFIDIHDYAKEYLTSSRLPPLYDALKEYDEKLIREGKINVTNMKSEVR